jgi:hypothetical protein
VKLLSIFIGLIISISATGQQLTYRGGLVDTLKIISNSSYYHFDTCGTTTGIYDEFVLVFSKEKKNYILSPFQRTEYKITFKPDTSFIKEKIIKQGVVVDRQLISSLLAQFEITYRQPSFDNLGMTTEEFFKLTDKMHIIQVAKWHDTDWQFKNSYSTKEQNDKIFKGCQNTDTLNLYLASVFDTSGYAMVTDVSDLYSVHIITPDNKFNFEGKYPNSFKQPWYDHSDTKNVLPTSILNLSINNALVAILPNNFSRLGTLKFEALINEYIEWYLKRRRIIF